MMNEIANFMVDYGTENTTYGNYCFYYKDLEEDFKIKLDEKTIDSIINALSKREEIADIDYDEEEISLYFYTNYCPNIWDNEEEDDYE